MEVENRGKCAEGVPALYESSHKDQVIQRFTIFLTDEDENDLTIEESEEEKLHECDRDEEPGCSRDKIGCPPKKRRGRKQKKTPEFIENDPEESVVKKRKRTTFCCHHCAYSSSWKTNLEKHLMAQHTGERPFKCPHCEYSSVHQFQLEKHWVGHHDEAVVHCASCDFTASAIEAYFKHFAHSHAGSKPHNCSECGKRAVSLSALELHIFEKHSSIVPTHECTYCPYKTVLSENLRNHIDALHKCSDCDFFSESLREVRRHRKKEHRISMKMNNHEREILERQIAIKNNNAHDINKDDLEDSVDSLPLRQRFPVFSPPRTDDVKSYNESNKFPVIVSPGSAPDRLKC